MVDLPEIKTWEELYFFLKGLAAGAGIYVDAVDSSACIISHNQPKWMRYTIVINRSETLPDLVLYLGHEMGHVLSVVQFGPVLVKKRLAMCNENPATEFITSIIKETKIKLSEEDEKKILDLEKDSNLEKACEDAVEAAKTP
jgi:hypothetical protein